MAARNAWRVLWTRGQGCADLAGLLSDNEPVRVVGDVREACLRHRADLLVSRKLSAGFDLVNTAMPVDLDPSAVGRVVATVAGGPHSSLAAEVAERLAAALGTTALMVYAYRESDDELEAGSIIERLTADTPHLEHMLIKADDPAGLVAQLPDRALIVLGSPGGGWLQRTFFGPGAKLRSEATAGAVIVGRAPARVYQVMTDPVFVGPLRLAGDILRLHREAVLAVVDRANLIGMVRREVLERAEPDTPVESLMQPAVSVAIDATAEEAQAVAIELGAGPVPVVDEDGRLVGSLTRGR